MATHSGWSRPLVCLEIVLPEPWPRRLPLALAALLRPLADPRAHPMSLASAPVNSMTEFLPQASGLAELAVSRACTLPTHSVHTHTCPHCLHTQKHHAMCITHANTTHICHELHLPHTLYMSPTDYTHIAHVHTPARAHHTCTHTGPCLSHITPPTRLPTLLQERLF